MWFTTSSSIHPWHALFRNSTKNSSPSSMFISLLVIERFDSFLAFAMYSSEISSAMTSYSIFFSILALINGGGYAVSDGGGYAVSDGGGYAVSSYRLEQCLRKTI
ncbi:hypothetical protein Tco_0915098 [Tanacetum coccineum]